MKTKLTLFVAVLAVALLGMGCVSTDTSGNQKPAKPEEPKEPAFVKEGLVAYYPFNGNAKDESGNGNHGDTNGTVLVEDRHGNKDSAYGFDGVDDNIQIPETKDFEANSITLSLWIQTQQPKTAEIIGKDGESRRIGERQWIIETSPDGQIIGDVWTSTSGHRGHIGYSRNRINLIEWNHIALCWDGSNYQIYLNALKDIVVATGDEKTLAAGDQPVRIGGGAPDGAAPFYFKGSIDDIRIYNRALSAAEVKALYDLEKPKGK